MARFDLSDNASSLIRPLLPNKPRGVVRVDDRRVINGIFYVLRTGSPWRNLPERCGPYTTVYNRFNRWARAGCLGQALRGSGRQATAFHGVDRFLHHPRPSARCRRKKGGEDHAIGRSRGGLGTKINAIVNENGLPVRQMLTASQTHDTVAAPALLAGLQCRHVAQTG